MTRTRNHIPKRFTAGLSLALAAAVSFAVAAPAAAEQVTFTLVPEASTLLATGTLSGDTPFSQTFGSNLTTFSGSILADRTATAIQFLDGSSIDATPQAQQQEPDIDGFDGRATADYGWVADNAFGETVAAFRDITLGLLSEMLPVAGGTFAGGDVEIVMAGGAVDWNSGFTFDRDDFTGIVRANVASNAPTLESADGVETLTLPVRFSILFSTVTSGDSTLRLSGNLVAVRDTTPAPQWITNGGGSWGNGANWSTGSPAAGSASFLGALTSDNSPALVTLDGDRSIARLTFSNDNTYDIAPGAGGTLTVGGATSGSITVQSGQHRISAPMRITGAVTMNVSDTAALDITALLPVAAGQSLIKAGGGTLRLAALTNAGETFLDAGSTEFTGPVTNNDGGFIAVSESTAHFQGAVTNNAGAELSIDFDATATFTGNVTNHGLISGSGAKNFDGPGNALGTIIADGTTNIAPATTSTATSIREFSLNVFGNLRILPNGTPTGGSLLFGLFIDSNGVLDLTNNHLIIDSGDLTQITSYITSDALTSSSQTAITTLAAILNDRGDGTPLHQMWNGDTVLATDVLVKYTYHGDANLDGRVTTADYLRIDRGLARELTGWLNGDFDFSGAIDAADYFLIDQAFLGQGAPLAAIPPHAAPVPEPSALAAGLLLLPLLRRRGQG